MNDLVVTALRAEVPDIARDETDFSPLVEKGGVPRLEPFGIARQDHPLVTRAEIGMPLQVVENRLPKEPRAACDEDPHEQAP